MEIDRTMSYARLVAVALRRDRGSQRLGQHDLCGAEPAWWSSSGATEDRNEMRPDGLAREIKWRSPSGVTEDRNVLIALTVAGPILVAVAPPG